jgi:hypothetical protein
MGPMRSARSPPLWEEPPQGQARALPRTQRKEVALICIVGTQLVFWFFTFPVNQQTVNWTVAPNNWMALRNQWEYSHAASCGLNFIALVALIGAAVVRER